MKKDNANTLDEYIKSNHILSKNGFIIDLINDKINYKKGEKMDKIKATELFKELVKSSQKAYAARKTKQSQQVLACWLFMLLEMLHAVPKHFPRNPINKKYQ